MNMPTKCWKFESDCSVNQEVAKLSIIFGVNSREIFASYVFPYKNEMPLSR